MKIKFILENLEVVDIIETNVNYEKQQTSVVLEDKLYKIISQAFQPSIAPEVDMVMVVTPFPSSSSTRPAKPIRLEAGSPPVIMSHRGNPQ